MGKHDEKGGSFLSEGSLPKDKESSAGSNPARSTPREPHARRYTDPPLMDTKDVEIRSAWVCARKNNQRAR
jgi:hypothetical protein